MASRYDFMGRRFGRLVAVGFTRENGVSFWVCDCDCGKSTTAETAVLRRGMKQSCGCLQRERTIEAVRIHGGADGGKETPEYSTYKRMRLRCYWTGHVSFKNYGGRGIKVCDRWLNGDGERSGFECFLSDMGPKPTPKHSIDRHPDNNGNYEPGNCRWATVLQQRRKTRKSRIVEVGDNRVCLTEACEMLGISHRKANYMIQRGATWDAVKEALLNAA